MTPKVTPKVLVVGGKANSWGIPKKAASSRIQKAQLPPPISSTALAEMP